MIRPFALFGACAMIVALFGIAAYWGGLGKKAQLFMHGFYPSGLTPAAPTPAPVVVHRPTSDTAAHSGPLKEKTGNFDASSSSVNKNIQAEKQASLSHNPKRVVVKKGDTLHEIAYRFFPENVDEGLKKILKVNPRIDDMNLLYKGQELIIPEADLNGKDPG